MNEETNKASNTGAFDAYVALNYAVAGEVMMNALDKVLFEEKLNLDADTCIKLLVEQAKIE
jgi:hypothetical protein